MQILGVVTAGIHTSILDISIVVYKHFSWLQCFPHLHLSELFHIQDSDLKYYCSIRGPFIMRCLAGVFLSRKGCQFWRCFTVFQLGSEGWY
jgi:hypothetical protein